MIDEVAAGEDGRCGWLDSEEARALRGLVATAVVDERGIFRSASDRWCALVRRSREEVVGTRWEEILGPEAGEVDLGSAVEGSGTTREFESRITSPDGRCGRVRVEAAPLP